MAKEIASKTDHIAAQLLAQAELQAAQAKAVGKYSASVIKAKGQQAQAQYDARLEAAQAQADAEAAGSETPVGPPVASTPFPPARNPSQSVAGSTMPSVEDLFGGDPSSVAGGGGIQAATGGMGRAVPTPEGGGYVAPARLTDVSQQQTTQQVTGGLGGFTDRVPVTSTNVISRDNRLTAEAAGLLNQRAVFEQRRHQLAERTANVAAAQQAIRDYGASGAALAGAIVRGEPLTAELFKSAGKTLGEKGTEAQIRASDAAAAASAQQTKYYNNKMGLDEREMKLRERAADNADKLFEVQRSTMLAELAKTLGLSGGSINSSNLPLNMAGGVTSQQAGGASVQQRLVDGLNDANSKIFTDVTKAGVVARGKAGISVIDPLEFQLNVGNPAAALNQVVVRGTTPSFFGLGKTVDRFETVPMETFMAEWLLSKGRVPGAPSKRVEEARKRILKWGHGATSGTAIEGDDYRALNYYREWVDTAMEQYRGTQVEQDALRTLGVAPVQDKPFRPTPEARRARETEDIQRGEQARRVREGLKEFESLQKEMLKELGQ